MTVLKEVFLISSIFLQFDPASKCQVWNKKDEAQPDEAIRIQIGKQL